MMTAESDRSVSTHRMLDRFERGDVWIDGQQINTWGPEVASCSISSNDSRVTTDKIQNRVLIKWNLNGICMGGV